jgi:hypothetical protein
MDQAPLFDDSLLDACTTVVKALGGFKVVGPTFWPEKTSEEAANHLRDCLNVDRRSVLHPEQILMLMRMGKKSGCHALAAYMLRDCGYADPVPIEPEDEKARLMREFNTNTKALLAMATRIEALGGPQLKKVA